MNPQETQQVVARDEKWVPSYERVKISSTNIRLETTVPQKEETFQVVIDIIKNSTCFKAFTISVDILPKKSKGKGSKGKKTAEESQEIIDVSEESEPEPEPAKKKSQSISQTEAEEAEATRKVHVTHAKIVIESVSESAKKNSSGRSSKSTSSKLLRKVRRQAEDNLVPKAQMKELGVEQDSEFFDNDNDNGDVEMDDKDNDVDKDYKDDDADDEGDDYVSDTQDADDEDDKTESDEDEIYKYKIRVRKDEDVEMKDAEVEESDKDEEKDSTDADVSSLLDIPIQHKTPHTQSPSIHNIPVSVIPKTTNLPPILEIITRNPVSTAVPLPQVTHIISTVQQTPKPILTPPITTDVLTIIIVVHESNALSVVELRDAKLEKDVSELKTIDHSSEALAHLPELIKKPTPTAEQESKKSPSDILKIKNEQAEKQKKPQFTIKYPANHRLYHALMKALIEDENVMDKGVADIVKDHKRMHDDDEDDDDKDLPAGLNQGKKTKRKRTKESESLKKPSITKDTSKGKASIKGSKTSKSGSVKEPVEEPIAEVVMDDAGNDVAHDDNQPQDTSEPISRKTMNLECFKQPPRPPTPDLEWNKHRVILDQPAQPLFNQMVFTLKDPLTFNDLMATPIHFSKYMLNGLKIENITQDILLGPAFSLLKGTCSSSIEFEYNFQECFNALTDNLDWNNPEGNHYLFFNSNCGYMAPSPEGSPCHRTIAADYFFNNDVEYLKTFDPEVTYTTFVTKTKATRYEIKGIKDMVPTLWSTIKRAYEKYAEKGIKHWGERRKLWYQSQIRKFSKQNVYSTKEILGVKSVSVKKLHGYGHLEEIVVKRSDQQLYKFKEDDFVDLHLNYIEDMLLLVVQNKLFYLDGNVIIDFMVALCMFTKSLILKRRVKDLQLGVESYQNKLNITKPQKTFLEIEFKKPYTPSYDPPGIIYKDMDKQKRVLRADELYKFSGWHTQVCSR
uniref:Uncharacterized protein n=1 Tax=Tanacetum cinerariifolium TaxID=118510 RepID=A0A699ILX0_TANCI|nr:hypothetical protein [Tanacetum cinerariifolium]